MYRKVLRTISLSALLCASSSLTAQEIRDDKPANDGYGVIEYDNPVDMKINELADNLLASSRINKEDMQNIAITSFVNLHNLERTSYFGRTISEAFFNELFVRGFNVVDFRGKRNISINNTGEFFITRDIKKVRKEIKNKYVLVGTYTVLYNKILINARIMDNLTGELVATGKTYIRTNDCKLLGTCPKPRKIRIISEEYMSKNDSARYKQKTPKSTPPRSIGISK